MLILPKVRHDLFRDRPDLPDGACGALRTRAKRLAHATPSWLRAVHREERSINRAGRCLVYNSPRLRGRLECDCQSDDDDPAGRGRRAVAASRRRRRHNPVRHEARPWRGDFRSGCLRRWDAVTSRFRHRRPMLRTPGRAGGIDLARRSPGGHGGGHAAPRIPERGGDRGERRHQHQGARLGDARFGWPYELVHVGLGTGNGDQGTGIRGSGIGNEEPGTGIWDSGSGKGEPGSEVGQPGASDPRSPSPIPDPCSPIPA